MPRVDFTVTTKDGTRAFEIDVDMNPIPLNNGRGSANLRAGNHVLVWRFAGPTGAKIAIVGATGAATVVAVKQSTIPPGRPVGAGFKPFTV
jgi:hypothetical protein